MPYVSNMDEEQQNPNAPQGAVSPSGGGAAPVRLSPSSAVPTVGGGGTSGASTGATPTPVAGGQFASLQNYLSANQGQAAPLAAKITPGINQQYSNLQNQSNATIADINKQVQNAPGYTPSNPDLLAKEAANPVSFTGDQGNIKQFQSLLQNAYGGPTSVEGTPEYANQQAAINQAIATGQSQTGTEAGRENLISQNEATPTSGVTALNEAILSQDPNALASIQKAYDPFKNLVTGLQSGAADVNKQIVKEQQDAAASAKAAQDAISGQITGLNTGITGKLTAAQQNAAQQNARLLADVQNKAISPVDAQALGITPDQATALWQASNQANLPKWVTGPSHGGALSQTQNIDWTPFLQQTSPNAITSANVATPEDYAKAQAFQTLLQGMNLQTPTMAINPATATQAGTAPTNLNTFDYNAALNAANAASSDETSAAQALANKLGAQNQANYDASKKGGFFDQFVSNPIVQYAANPLLVVPKELKKIGVR